MGTMADGLFGESAGSLHHLSVEEGLPDAFVHAVLVDRDGMLWAGTDAAGLIRKEEPLVGAIPSDLMPEPVTSTVLADGAGQLWIGTRSRGLCRFRPSSGIRHFDTSSGLCGDRVRVLSADPLGRIWVGTEDGGVTRIDPDGMHTLNSRNGLLSDHVTSIVEDGSGGVWIGTDRGLNRWREGVIDVFGPGSALSETYITSLIPGADHSVYIGTKRGVFQYIDGKFSPLTTEAETNSHRSRLRRRRWSPA
jgi:ligand-binding sensor domain-containing protein